MNIKTNEAQHTDLDETAKGLKKVDRDSLTNVTGGGGADAGGGALRDDGGNWAVIRGPGEGNNIG